MSTTTTHQVHLDGVGAVPLTVTTTGPDQGRAFLLLHGGAGPQSVNGFAKLFAQTHDVRVFTPTHPGFGATERPDTLHTVKGLASLYSALLDKLDLTDVTVVGNSIGGWIAAELALLGSPRVSGMIIVNGVGIEVPGHPIADFFTLTLEQVFQRSYHNPEPFLAAVTNLPQAARAVAAGNRAALATYAGTAMSDPTLAARLATLEVPTLVLWGESDRIADPDYGRAYAAAIPMAQFRLLADTGHVPQVETPMRLVEAIWNSTATDVTGPAS